MPSVITLPTCFAIVGHHRSGTSLVANMLQSAGLDIGERLMEAAPDNKHGYFEDLDFYEFHIGVLRAQGFHETGLILQSSVPVPRQYAHTARGMVQRRMEAGQPWGWKEPRTTLFLDFWHEIIPQLKVIILFRAPWEVVDSLFRRGDTNYLKNPSMAVRVWMAYNRAVLDFHAQHPEKCVIVESYAAARDPARILEVIAEKFGHHFGPISDVYDEEIYSHHTSPQHMSVLARCFPEALEMYEDLRRKADMAVPEELLPERSTSVSAVDDWALQHWVDWRAAERLLKHYQSELERRSAELQQLQAAAPQRCTTCQQTAVELHNLRVQTKQLQDELEQARQQVQPCIACQQAGVELHSLRGQTDRLRADLELAHAAYQTADAERHQFHTLMKQLGAELEQTQQQSQEARTAYQAADAERQQFHALTKRLLADLELTQQQTQEARIAHQEAQAAYQAADAERHQLDALTKQLHTDLEQTRLQAQQARAAHQQADAELNSLRVQTDQFQDELKQTQQANAELNALRAQLQQLRDNLEQTQQQAQQAQGHIAWMQSSSFWKLRHLWQRLKHPLRDEQLKPAA